MVQTVDTIVDVPCFLCLLKDKSMVSPHRCNPEKCIKLERWLLKTYYKEPIKYKPVKKGTCGLRQVVLPSGRVVLQMEWGEFIITTFVTAFVGAFLYAAFQYAFRE